MPDEEKSFWTTMPGIFTGLAAIITAATGLIVALNGAGLFNKRASGYETSVETKAAPGKNVDSLSGKRPNQQHLAVILKTVFAQTTVKIEDHEYKIVGSSVKGITPASSSLAIDIRYKNNSNYSPAPFWNQGFRLEIDGSLTSPIGDLSKLVERHAELDGTVIFEVPNSAKNLALHILDGEKDIAVPLKLVLD